MATSTKVVLALALSEYKQLLDKYALFLQLPNTSEEENAQRRRRIVSVLQLKSEPEWEMMLSMDDYSFTRHFRVTKPQFECLARKLRENGLEKQHSHGLPAVPATKKVLIFLWFMANQDSFRQISGRFGVSQSSAHRVIQQALNIMSTIGTSFVSWPNADEKAASAAAFHHLCGIKGVIGAIDGCHIRIQRPPIRGGDYMNHKSRYSVLLQGIVDERGRFIDIFAGPPGKVCDARMLRASDFYAAWQEKMGDHSLLGDSAYTGHAFPFVISPKREEALLTEADQRQNSRINCGRMVVEQAFGRMKCKWRRLRDLQNTRMDTAVMIILAACFLHNMCLGVTEICQEHPDGCPRLADENE
ncbi:uncharacterized protein ACB057_007849 [Neosynchiropus ocellatus]